MLAFFISWTRPNLLHRDVLDSKFTHNLITRTDRTQPSDTYNCRVTYKAFQKGLLLALDAFWLHKYLT